MSQSANPNGDVLYGRPLMTLLFAKIIIKLQISKVDLCSDNLVKLKHQNLAYL